MQPKTLPRYVGVLLLLLTLVYFLGVSNVLPASSHPLFPSQLQTVAPAGDAPGTNDMGGMRKGSGTAIPDTISDLILTGVCVLITAVFSLFFFLSQRKRYARQEHLQNPETDPIIARVSIAKQEVQPVPGPDKQGQSLPLDENGSRVTRLKHRLRSM